jgi:hypothetical protein
MITLPIPIPITLSLAEKGYKSTPTVIKAAATRSTGEKRGMDRIIVDPRTKAYL